MDDIQMIKRVANVLRGALFSGESIKFWNDMCIAIPALAKNYNCPQSPKWHPEGPVHIHICKVIDNVASQQDITMSMAALFHDMGKAYVHTETPLEDGSGTKISHIGHELKSADFVKQYKDLIEATGADYEKVYNIVKHHMRTHLYISGKMSNPGKRRNFEAMLEHNALVVFAAADKMDRPN